MKCILYVGRENNMEEISANIIFNEGKMKDNSTTRDISNKKEYEFQEELYRRT
jgi:hypothetical protein